MVLQPRTVAAAERLRVGEGARETVARLQRGAGGEGQERGICGVGEAAGTQRTQEEVATVVVILVDHQLLQLRELDLERVAVRAQREGHLLQLAFGANAVVEVCVLHQCLRTGLVDEHADALHTPKTTADLEMRDREITNGIKETERKRRVVAADDGN